MRRNSALLLVGAGLLLFRTIALLRGGAVKVLKPWVVMLTLLEMLVDVVTIWSAAMWWRTSEEEQGYLARRAGALATVLHAIRVGIFVLGRTGPWFDFDVKPEERSHHRERWTWFQVIFAATLSMLGVLAVLYLWRRGAGAEQKHR